MKYKLELEMTQGEVKAFTGMTESLAESFISLSQSALRFDHIESMSRMKTSAAVAKTAASIAAEKVYRKWRWGKPYTPSPDLSDSPSWNDATGRFVVDSYDDDDEDAVTFPVSDFDPTEFKPALDPREDWLSTEPGTLPDVPRNADDVDFTETPPPIKITPADEPVPNIDDTPQ